MLMLVIVTTAIGLVCVFGLLGCGFHCVVCSISTVRRLFRRIHGFLHLVFSSFALHSFPYLEKDEALEWSSMNMARSSTYLMSTSFDSVHVEFGERVCFVE